MRKTLPKKSFLVPAAAKLAFKGDLFEVYQWNQEMFDGTSKVFEMLKRPDTMQIIAVKGEKIVVVDDEQPGRPAFLSMPGGRADDDDESWEAAAKRELLEETGMSFANWKLLEVEQPAPKIEWFCPIFVATDFLSQVNQQLDGGEKISVIEMSFKELKEKAMNGDNPKLGYLVPTLNKYSSLKDLLAAPEFQGQLVER